MKKLATIKTDYRLRVIEEGPDGFAASCVLDGEPFLLIVSIGRGWDHVSLSHAERLPTWDEMQTVYRMCFGPKEVAVQYHVPAGDHVNVHPYCLHLWRPRGRLRIPVPPVSFV